MIGFRNHYAYVPGVNIDLSKLETSTSLVPEIIFLKMDVLSLLQAGFNGAKRDQENHRQSKRKKKTQSSKGQKQARTRSVAGVLYSALVYNCWCCCSGQLQILVLLLLLLLLQWQQTKSHVKKSAACGDMHGNWGACSNAN
jgi:hypothetical protein